MRVFVAGASGVIGRSLIPMLVERGHTVRGLIRSANTFEQLRRLGAEPAVGDLLADQMESELFSAVNGCEAIVHVATALGDSARRPTEAALKTTGMLRTQGTRRLLSAARRCDARVYVQESLELAYPDGGDSWLDESTPIDTAPNRAALCGPVIEMERLLHSELPSHCRSAILRAGRLVGPGTAQEQVIDEIRRKSFVVSGDGENFVSLVHVADYARAIAFALEASIASVTLNVNSEPLREGEYYDALAASIGAPAPPRDAHGRGLSQRCSSNAASTLLGWQADNDVVPPS